MSELRHITSNSVLVASHRLSQHIRTSPARSPNSIPSSPTSVHSSSSAIFERDIEPISPSPTSALHTHNQNHHRIPRSKTTEQIEHSVPSVLDSAAAILASIQTTNDVAVVAPAPYATTTGSFAGSGFASPIGSFRSRSPSPTIGSLAVQGRNSLLLNIPQQHQSYQQPHQQQQNLNQQQQQQQAISGSSPPHSSSGIPSTTSTSTSTNPRPAPPSIKTNASPSQPAPPSIVNPTSDVPDSPSIPPSEPPTLDEPPPLPQNTASSTASSSQPQPPPPPTTISASPPSPNTLPLPLSHPHTPTSPSSHAHAQIIHSPISPTSPSPSITTHASTSSSSAAAAAAATKRLSFISYADLLTSTPTSTLPLASLTTAASAIEPPPHITSVAAAGIPGTVVGGVGAGVGGAAPVSHPGSAGTSLRGFVINPVVVPGAAAAAVHHAHGHGHGIGGFNDPFVSGVPNGHGHGSGGMSRERERENASAALAMLEPGTVDDVVGGEWEREGLGKGLEERLDVLYGSVVPVV